jgi:hypothetical protein
MQLKTEEHIQSVNEARDAGEGAEKVNDRGGRKNDAEEGETREGKEAGSGDAEAEEETRSLIRDPALGRNIDISG